MKTLRQALDRIPRPVRVLVDLLLVALLLQVRYIARGSPPFCEEAAFRRAEQAAMVGPSVLLDRMFTSGDWPFVNYNLLLIGDAGDSILFYTMHTGRNISTSMDNVLTRREKTDGILLTTLPTDIVMPSNALPPGPVRMPLFLFVDDPAAVKAKLHMTLSDGSELTLAQIRDWHNHELLSEEERIGYVTGTVRNQIFVFEHPITSAEWKSDWADIMRTNEHYPSTMGEWPVTIELYDLDNHLIRTVDYTIRSRAGDASAAQ